MLLNLAKDILKMTILLMNEHIYKYELYFAVRRYKNKESVDIDGILNDLLKMIFLHILLKK